MQKQIDGQLSFDDILAQLEAEKQYDYDKYTSLTIGNVGGLICICCNHLKMVALWVLNY